jgi:hypothetical protein
MKFGEVDQTGCLQVFEKLAPQVGLEESVKRSFNNMQVSG